ncbi:dihydroxy-acid dehydratase, mitochondrial [Trichomonascus vanleenenianus]|uniref:dihydroxy-acid dehydratase n=1 Tax=Trichomonascus vanleenenianus TaxID=2268995 RepID=UPI003ECB6C8E
MSSNFLHFQHLPATDENGQPNLKRYSTTITNTREYPGAEAMLYGAGIKNEDDMRHKPQVGISSVWWEGNPCNMHLLDLGKTVKEGVDKEGMIGWQFNAIGVSDAITMGNQGMRFSLQSREIIADSFETVTCAQWHDANISIPGCDKNMPGVLMAMARFNRPALMIYGGTIKPGYSEKLGEPVLVSNCFEAHGALNAGKCDLATFDDIVKHACPGAGACGGQYTANTMSTAAEAMGMSLPGSSSTPAESPAKMRECLSAGKYIKILMEKDIKPRDIMTREAFENAIVMTMALGGSTNACLHLLAIAHSADVPLTIDDIHKTSDRVPYIADLKPSGKYVMEDLYNIGGVPAVMKLLDAAGFLNGDILTVTGKTLRENLKSAPSLPQDQVIIRPLDNPIKKTGHIRVLKGNIAPDGAVAKITGKEGTVFTGRARVFDSEEACLSAIKNSEFNANDHFVLVVRYEGPRGGPGMPEMLKVSGMLMGTDLGKRTALITDGRYSGASHGFIIGHICPEAQNGGPIAVIEDDDIITIDSVKNTIDMDVPESTIKARLAKWRAPPLKVKRGTLAKYAALVSDASSGCVLDKF